MEVTIDEFHKFRTYSFIGLTLCFTVFLMILTGFGIAEGGMMLQAFISIDCLVLIPLGLGSFYFYYFRLWIKFVIDEEKFEIVRPHSKKTILWSEFDIMKLKVKGRHYGLTEATTRRRVDFKIRLFHQGSKKNLRYIHFAFIKQSNGETILNAILTYSQDKGKDVILTKRYM